MSIRPLCCIPFAALCALLPAQGPGYTDTPVLPDSKWRVHDANRPRPRAVTPGTVDTAPSDAVVLFDGTDLSKWTGRNDAAGWKVENGYVEVNGTGDIRTREQFGDCQLHIEWAAPAEVKGSSQGRGNSGVYFMGRYEVQVLDSYENESYADGQAAALYGQFPPAVNASRKPGAWQSYDIVFIAPRFEDGELVSPARFTVFHNGVLMHHDRAMLGASAHKVLPKYKAHPPKGSLKLQDHGNPVRFRNIWIRELDGAKSPTGAGAMAGAYALDVEAVLKALDEALARKEGLSPEERATIREQFGESLGTIEKVTIVLAADGTWTGESVRGDHESKAEGTWKRDGDGLQITVVKSSDGGPTQIDAASWSEAGLVIEQEMGGITVPLLFRRQ